MEMGLDLGSVLVTEMVLGSVMDLVMEMGLDLGSVLVLPLDLVLHSVLPLVTELVIE